MVTTLYAGVISLTGKWVGGQVTCQMYGFIQSTLTLVSVWTIAALSWDKYQTIASPLHHSMTAKVRKMTMIFGIFWASAVVLAIPPLLGENEYVFYPVAGTCFMNHLDIASRWYVGIFISFMFYIPLLVMLYCYTHIFRIARTQSSRIAATMVRMACVVQAPVTPNTPATSTDSTIKGTKAMMTILQLVGAFTVTYIPYSVFILFEACAGSRTLNAMVISIVITLFQAAPMTNSAIYGMRNKILRKSFIRYVRRKIQHFCYKDKRRGSVKSMRRSSSFRISLLQRKGSQRYSTDTSGPLRRTQSLQVKKTSRSNLNLVDNSETLRKVHSFSIPNGNTLSNSSDIHNSELTNSTTVNTPTQHVNQNGVTILRKISDQPEPEDDKYGNDQIEIKIHTCKSNGHVGNGYISSTENTSDEIQSKVDIFNGDINTNVLSLSCRSIECESS